MICPPPRHLCSGCAKAKTSRHICPISKAHWSEMQSRTSRCYCTCTDDLAKPYDLLCLAQHSAAPKIKQAVDMGGWVARLDTFSVLFVIVRTSSAKSPKATIYATFFLMY
nr:hypothetical protein CFP56_23901 [Quercus suber]